MLKNGQGATEYVLMLAAVLLIVAVSLVFVFSLSPKTLIVGAAVLDNNKDVVFTPTSMMSDNIPAADWRYAIYRDATPVKDWVDSPGDLVKNIPILLDANDSAAKGDKVIIEYKGTVLPAVAVVG